MSLEESENHCSMTKWRVAEGRECRELLVAEVKSLKEEPANYKVEEEGCWANKKILFLKSSELFDLLGSRFAFLLELDFKVPSINFRWQDTPQSELPLIFLDLQKVVDSILENKIVD